MSVLSGATLHEQLYPQQNHKQFFTNIKKHNGFAVEVVAHFILHVNRKVEVG